MIVALDVGYNDTPAETVGMCGLVGFNGWTDGVAAHELTVVVRDVAPYVSGAFYQRELPCLLQGLAQFGATTGENVDVVMVDGNVRLDQNGAPGLGRYLFDELQGAVPVVGVAKHPFKGLQAAEVHRGTSSKPLYVTAAGMDEQQAAAHVASMAGPFRIPALLQRADQLSRTSPP